VATSTAPRRDTMHPRDHPPQPALAGRALRAMLDLGAVPTAPGCARAWTRQILRERRLEDLSEAAEGIVSELVTNAGLASRPLVSPVIGLVLTFDRGELAILVRDFCPGVPQPRQAGADDESGRGLLLVEAMSDRSGWYPFEDGTPGKVVWAVIQATPAASSDLTARFMPSAPA
jgi:anti-sigma regulatory factor (Ser/Thr protein kinase)